MRRGHYAAPPRCATVVTASGAAAWRPPPGWAGTAGSSSGPSPGLTGYRRLTLRYERCARLFTAFLTLAAALTCYKKLTT